MASRYSARASSDGSFYSSKIQGPSGEAFGLAVLSHDIYGTAGLGSAWVTCSRSTKLVLLSRLYVSELGISISLSLFLSQI